MTYRLNAAIVPLYAFQAARGGPATVAVHYDRHMAYAVFHIVKVRAVQGGFKNANIIN